MVENKREVIEYDDVTENFANRIPSRYGFHTIWLTNPLELREFYSTHDNESKYHKRDLNNLRHMEKLAVARHKKALEIELGLREEHDGKKPIKLIYQNTPNSLLVDDFYEKNKLLVSKDGTTLKKDIGSYVEYNEKNAKLMEQFHQKIDEAVNIKAKLFKRD